MRQGNQNIYALEDKSPWRENIPGDLFEAPGVSFPQTWNFTNTQHTTHTGVGSVGQSRTPGSQLLALWRKTGEAGFSLLPSGPRGPTSQLHAFPLSAKESCLGHLCHANHDNKWRKERPGPTITG